MKSNFYAKWIKNNRVFLYGTFLLLLGIFLQPIVRQANYKNKCIDFVVEANLLEAEKQKIKTFQNLPIDKWAHINAYRQCNNTSAK